MSFTSYLINMGIDALLVIVGFVGLVASFAMLIEQNMVLAVIFLIIGGLPILYTRYRARKLGITY